jgi:hypothetical protein
VTNLKPAHRLVHHSSDVFRLADVRLVRDCFPTRVADLLGGLFSCRL